MKKLIGLYNIKKWSPKEIFNDVKKHIQGVTPEKEQPEGECEITFVPTYKNEKIQNDKEGL